jgi:hypothetical protein
VAGAIRSALLQKRMVMHMTNMDVESKKTNPSAAYNHPEEILSDDALNREQKIEILREWYYDAMRLQESDSENMTGGEPDRLQSVSKALLKLGVSPVKETDTNAQTKSSPLRKAHRYISNAVDALRGKAP